MKRMSLLALVLTGLLVILGSTFIEAAEPLMIQDMENMEILEPAAPEGGGWAISAGYGEDGFGVVFDSVSDPNLYEDWASAEYPMPVQIGPDICTDAPDWNPEFFNIPAGYRVKLTYDGGQAKTVYLPHITAEDLVEGWCELCLPLYVASDGSTYYDEALTDLAQGTPSAFPFTEDFTTDTYKDAETTTADWNTTDGEGKLWGYKEIRINTYTEGNQQSPVITVRSDGTFLAVWYGEGESDDWGIYGQLFNSDGTKYGEEFRVNTYPDGYQSAPAVATRDDGGFVVVWYSSGREEGSLYDVYGQLFNSDGTKYGEEFRVNTYTNGFQSAPSVAMRDDGEFVVVWQDDRNGASGYFQVYGQIFNSDSTRIGEEFQVNISPPLHVPHHPSVAMRDDSTFVVIWGRGEIYGQLFNSDGTRIGEEFRVNTYMDYEIVGVISIATSADGRFVVVWQGHGQQEGNVLSVYGQLFNSDGTKYGEEFRVNTYTNGYQVWPSVAMRDDGRFVVVWESYLSPGHTGFYGQLFNSDGTKIGDEFQVNASCPLLRIFGSGCERPSVAMLDDGTFVTVWASYHQDGHMFGIYGNQHSATGAILTPKYYYASYGNTLQSTTISSEAVRGVTLTADDTIPESASITYYVTNSAGVGICAQNPYDPTRAESYCMDMEDSTHYFGQSFVAETESLNYVSFYAVMDANGETHCGEVKIYATEDDLINDTNSIAIASLILNYDEYAYTDIQTVKFDLPVSVIPGETYYFAFRPTAYVYIEGGYDSAGDTYPNGQLYVNANVWYSDVLEGDLFFEVGRARQWEEVTPDEYHEFSDPTGTDIRWKAVLGEATEPAETPIINSITIEGKLPPDKELEALITTVEEMDIPQQIESSLEAKLETALDKVLTAQADIESGDVEHAENMVGAAVNKINAFINQVEAQLGKKITEEDALKLIEAAQSLITNIESLVEGL